MGLLDAAYNYGYDFGTQVFNRLNTINPFSSPSSVSVSQPTMTAAPPQASGTGLSGAIGNYVNAQAANVATNVGTKLVTAAVGIGIVLMVAKSGAVKRWLK